MEKAQAEAAREAARWRRDVVQHLLLPIEEIPAESFACPLLRSLPPSRRAEAHYKLKAYGSFIDSAAGRAEWELLSEKRYVEDRLQYWHRFNAKTISEAGRQKDEIDELNRQLLTLKARMAEGTADDVGRREGARESNTERQQRRLADLRALGGDWVKRRGKWTVSDRQSGVFAKLVLQERERGSPMFSGKSVREDLHAAAQAEADQKRAGAALDIPSLPHRPSRPP